MFVAPVYVSLAQHLQQLFYYNKCLCLFVTFRTFVLIVWLMRLGQTDACNVKKKYCQLLFACFAHLKIKDDKSLWVIRIFNNFYSGRRLANKDAMSLQLQVVQCREATCTQQLNKCIWLRAADQLCVAGEQLMPPGPAKNFRCNNITVRQTTVANET